jgi:hypothetical protein
MTGEAEVLEVAAKSARHKKVVDVFMIAESTMVVCGVGC